MQRPRAQRRGGSLHATVGYVAVGASAVVLLGAAPRELGVRAFGGLGLAWTVASIFGFGLAFPTEQLLSRRLNARLTQSTLRPVVLLGLAGIVCVVLAGGLHTTGVGEEFGPFVPSVAAAVIGWVAAAGVRGRLAGSGDLVAYGGVLLAETSARVAFVAFAALDRDHAGPLLGAAIGVPLLLSAGAGLLLTVGPTPPPALELEGDTSKAAEHGAFVALALGYQACLNGPPILLGLHASATGGLVGSFVAGNTYYRASTIVIGGVVTHALVMLSEAWGRRHLANFRGAERLALRNLMFVSAACLSVLSVMSPFLLHAYYGRPVEVPGGVQAALVASSFLASVAALGTQTLLAVGRATEAAACWLVAAAVSLGIFAFATQLDLLAATGLIAGPAIACAALFVRGRVVISRWSTTGGVERVRPEQDGGRP